VSDAAQTVNDLARKYKDVIVPPDSGKAGQPVKAKSNILADNIAKRQAYLNDPPADYTPADGESIKSWAEGQLKRVLEQQKAEKDASQDRQDQLSDYKLGLMTLIKKAESVTEGDKSLVKLEGSPDPKPQAAKTAAAGKSGEVKQSAESTDPNVNNAKTNYTSQDIKDHIEKVLGKSVRLAWAIVYPRR